MPDESLRLNARQLPALSDQEVMEAEGRWRRAGAPLPGRLLAMREDLLSRLAGVADRLSRWGSRAAIVDLEPCGFTAGATHLLSPDLVWTDGDDAQASWHLYCVGPGILVPMGTVWVIREAEDLFSPGQTLETIRGFIVGLGRHDLWVGENRPPILPRLELFEPVQLDRMGPRAQGIRVGRRERCLAWAPQSVRRSELPWIGWASSCESRNVPRRFRATISTEPVMDFGADLGG